MNIQALMKQAQSLQKDMLKSKEEIDKMEFTSTKDLVTVKVNGKKEVLKVDIQKDDDFSVDDLDILEDMIMVALNDAFKQVDKETEKKMGKYANAMPGLF
ncbi:MAG: YbaB/EbfC family nucleoid-associated protein [Bacilli bacterium]